MSTKTKTKTSRSSVDYTAMDDWLEDQPDSKELRAAFLELRDLFEKPRWHDLLWFHAVGRLTRRLCPKSRSYGAGVIDLLIAALRRDLKQDRNLDDQAIFLYRARDFASKYPLDADVKDLAQKKNKNGGKLTRAHISALLLVKDEKQRSRFLKKCLAQCWGGKELTRQIQNATGSKRSRGGRSPNPPKYTSPHVAIRDMAVMAKRWAAFHLAWFDEEVPLRKVPTKDQDKSLLEEIEDAQAGLKTLQADVALARKHLKLLASQVETKLAADAKRQKAGAK